MPTARSQQLALHWFKEQIHPNGYVQTSAHNPNPFPEVTGYSIPTLMQCGEHGLASKLAAWIVQSQPSEGGFLGADGEPQVFDTAQVLRGLIAIRPRVPGSDRAMVRAGDWLLAKIDTRTGAWHQESTASWAGIPEGVLCYAISPLEESLRLRGSLAEHERILQKTRRYYAKRVRVATNTHFLGYVAAGLLEMGMPKDAFKATRRRAEETWPGSAQLAETLFKLNRYDAAEMLLRRMMNNQRTSGGWTGGSRSYFADEEIPWAAKFYLDAAREMRSAWFNAHAHSISAVIDPADERLQAVATALDGLDLRRVLDAGCGTGRYLRHISQLFPEVKLYGCDPTVALLAQLPEGVKSAVGELTNLPFPTAHFDAAICVEALEHAVFTEQAIEELKRVVRPGGRVIIIDKSVDCWGRLPVTPWEQWFPDNLIGDMRKLRMDKELFRVWTYDVPKVG